MTWHCLALVRPLDTSSGLRVDVRVSSANLREITGMDGNVWEPAMAQAPAMGIDLFNGDFIAGVSPGGARLPLAMETVKETWSTVDTYNWAGAPVEIYAGRTSDAWPWDAVFKGRVSSFQRRGQVLTLAAAVDDEPFRIDLLTEYAGTGGAEGGADLKNRVKPLVIGRAKNVEPVLINATENVYQFSGYGPIEEVTTLFERAADFGVSQGDHADYAALVAATIPPGGWATCLAEGMIRLGAPAYGVITGDILGHEVTGATPRLTGAIISALADIAGIDSALIEAASLTAMDAAVPYNVNLVLTDQTRFFDMARRLALPCNYQAGVSLVGTFFVGRVDLGGSEVITLDAQGHALPQVTESTEEATSPPYSKTVMGADRCWRVHSLNEIAFYAPLIDMGLWNATTIYREGNIVNLADETRWLYINTTPSAGNVPTAGSLYWASLTGEEGISTERWPADPPTDWPIGSIYFGEDNHPYRFEGLELYCEDEQLFNGAEPLLGSGYVSVRDKTLSEVVAAIAALDDDDVLTTDEKVRVIIPENARLEAAYQGALARANLLGLNVTAMTDARSAWIALRDSLSPAWDDTSQNTPIVRDDWDTILTTYRQAIESANTTITTPGAITVIPPANQTVALDSDGLIESGEYPRTLTPTVKRGDVDIRDDDDVSYSIATSGITATVNNTNGSADKGKITATDGSSGYIDLSVTTGGVTFGPFRIVFTPDAVPIWTGTATSGKTELGNGLVLTWKEITVAANAAADFETYGDGHEYDTFAHAWLSGGIGGSNAQDNNPYIDFGSGGDTLTGAYISSARDASCTCKLMSIGL